MKGDNVEDIAAAKAVLEEIGEADLTDHDVIMAIAIQALEEPSEFDGDTCIAIIQALGRNDAIEQAKAYIEDEAADGDTDRPEDDPEPDDDIA